MPPPTPSQHIHTAQAKEPKRTASPPLWASDVGWEWVDSFFSPPLRVRMHIGRASIQNAHMIGKELGLNLAVSISVHSLYSSSRAVRWANAPSRSIGARPTYQNPNPKSPHTSLKVVPSVFSRETHREGSPLEPRTVSRFSRRSVPVLAMLFPFQARNIMRIPKRTNHVWL